MTQALDRKTGDLRRNARLCNNTNTIIIVPVLSRMPSSPPPENHCFTFSNHWWWGTCSERLGEVSHSQMGRVEPD